MILLHWLSAAYGWMLANNLWPDVMSSIVFVLVAWAWAQRKVFPHLREILRLLDTESPGGLGDVAKELRAQKAERPRQDDGGVAHYEGSD